MVGSGLGASVGVFRLPTDPLFYADLLLQNIVIGSRYRVTKSDDGTELATGVAGSTTVTLPGLAVYANPMLVNIVARKGTSAPKYEPFETFAYMTRGSVSAYIAQIPDPIA
ncbi:MAG: hypothetical protein MUF54_00125 [Polyangiaceae bacterium]|jgi:hypothetical protein|nr:hypothetical protein [Polyangiaceae bacterium]